MCGPVLQQTVSEAAVGGADIARRHPRRIHGEHIQRLGQLVAGAAGVFARLLLEGEQTVRRHRGAGLVRRDAAEEYPAGHDQPGGLLSGDMKLFGRQCVQPDGFHGRFRLSCRYGSEPGRKRSVPPPGAAVNPALSFSQKFGNSGGQPA